MYPDPNNLQEAVVDPKAQALIESSYLAMCDAQDGIKDGILNDPRQCKFDVSTLLCKGDVITSYSIHYTKLYESLWGRHRQP